MTMSHQIFANFPTTAAMLGYEYSLLGVVVAGNRPGV